MPCDNTKKAFLFTFVNKNNDDDDNDPVFDASNDVASRILYG